MSMPMERVRHYHHPSFLQPPPAVPPRSRSPMPAESKKSLYRTGSDSQLLDSLSQQQPSPRPPPSLNPTPTVEVSRFNNQHPVVVKPKPIWPVTNLISDASHSKPVTFPKPQKHLQNQKLAIINPKPEFIFPADTTARNDKTTSDFVTQDSTQHFGEVSNDISSLEYIDMRRLHSPARLAAGDRSPTRIRQAANIVASSLKKQGNLDSMTWSPAPPSLPPRPSTPSSSGSSRPSAKTLGKLKRLTPTHALSASLPSRESSEAGLLASTIRRWTGDDLYQHYHSRATSSDLVDSDDDDYIDLQPSTDEDNDENAEAYEDLTVYDSIASLSVSRSSPSPHQLPASPQPPPVPLRPRPANHQQAAALSQCVTKKLNGSRTLWREMPQVVNSGLDKRLSAKDIRLQETIFEIASSEVCYEQSLRLLCEHFMGGLLTGQGHETKQNRRHLFSNVKKVHAVSGMLLEILENEWSRGAQLDPGSLASELDVFCEEHCHIYIQYLKNEIFQQRCLASLKSTNAEFREKLELLENDPKCHKLDLKSFLALPMQRITRLPLLVDAVYKQLSPGHPAYCAVEHCMATLHKLTRRCNEEKRIMENLEELAQLHSTFDFSRVKLVSTVGQTVVKKGCLVRVHLNTSTLKKLLAKHKEPVYFYLLSDLLIIARARNDRSDKTYDVIDHVPRKFTDVKKLDEVDCPELIRLQLGSAFLLAVLEADNHYTEYILLCDNESDCERWVQAFTPVAMRDGEETYYASWDRPQVQATCRYLARQPDELSLEEGDVITVIKKHKKDGMYEGQRIRDGERGWFPASVSRDIDNEHSIAKNRRQLFRMMKFQQAVV